MTKKKSGKKLIIFSVIILLLIASFYFVFKGCSSDSISLGGDAGKVDTSDFEDWLLEDFEEEDEEPEPVYSLTLINKAYDNEDITEEEYFLLKVQEAFDHDSLPDEYKSERAERRDSSFLLLMIRDRIDDFSPKTQSILRPFVTNPDNPDSYWYKINQEDESLAEEFLDSIKIIPSAEAMDNPHPTTSEYFEVHYDDPWITDKADIVSAALNYSYNKYVNIGMKEPTDWIYVKIQSLGDDGQQYMDDHEGANRCHILISDSQSDEALKTSTAHELFHCFQQYIPLKSYSTEEWIWESTATWSEDFTYPNVNTEHGFDSNIFPYFYKDFFDSDNITYHQYGSYLWPWFLSHMYGKDGVVVKKMLDEAGSLGMKDAIKNRPNLYEEFKLYALYNYNKEPFKFYYDHNNKPTRKPSGKSKTKKIFSNKEDYTQNVALNPGGIMYHYFYFGDDIDKVEFDFSLVNTDAQPDFATQIIYKIGENWFYQDVVEQENQKKLIWLLFL